MSNCRLSAKFTDRSNNSQGSCLLSPAIWPSRGSGNRFDSIAWKRFARIVFRISRERLSTLHCQLRFRTIVELLNRFCWSNESTVRPRHHCQLADDAQLWRILAILWKLQFCWLRLGNDSKDDTRRLDRHWNNKSASSRSHQSSHWWDTSQW